MECQTCGSAVNHDVLYRCEQCLNSYCDRHINTHHGAANKGTVGTTFTTPIDSYSQSQQWQINLSQLGMQRQRVQYREPTQEEYEMYLRSNPQVLTTGRESLDLILGFLLIAFVFGFRPLIDGDRSMIFVLLLTLIIGPAFILHELAHKYAAIHYGKYARFTLIRQMAYLTLLFGFLGFGIAGPGATMIVGRSNERETGIFAAAGPATNFVLASLGVMMTLIVPNSYIPSIGENLHWVFYLIIFINSFLALFNLIPVSLLDGRKIKTWNQQAWILLIVLNLFTFFYALPYI